MTREGASIPQVALIGLFVTSLVTAQLTASKVLGFELPVAIPIAGESLALPGAALAYALTFLASDAYAELYGRRAAQILVNVSFGLNFLLLALVWSTIAAPAAPTSAVDPATFATVLASSTNIVIASLAAYLLSQNWDVVVFHALKERTDGAHLWLRNLASTATSQLLDTVIFVGLGFYLVPLVLGTADPVPGSVIASLIVGQYLLKLLIAVLDTPVVYLIVGAVRYRAAAEATAPAAD